MQNQSCITDKRFFMIKIVLFSIITVIVAMSALVLPVNMLEILFEHTAYYFIFISFFLWVLFFTRKYFNQFPELIKKYGAALILAVVLTSLIFVIAPPRFKILNDEPNMVGVSMMMFLEKKPALPLRGFYFKLPSEEFGNQTTAYELQIDKRPILYPFLISIVHSVAGYSGFNGMVVNFIASIFILLLFYIFVRKFFPAYLSFAAVLLMTASPIYIFCITSSSFETVNLLFIILTFVLFVKCLDTGDQQTVELFLLTLVLLFQCRYESKIFAISILFLLPAFKRNNIQFSFITYIIPILLLPILWQKRICSGKFLINQFPDYTLDIAPTAFSVDNLLNNIPKNIYTLSGFDANFGFTPLVFILSIAGSYLIIRELVTGTLKKKSNKLYIIFPFGLITFLMLFFIISAYYWGDFFLAMTNRYALPLLPFLVFASIFCINTIVDRYKPISSVFIILFCVFHLIYYCPVASQQKVLNYYLTKQYEYNKSLDFILPRFENYKTLIIYERTNMYLIHQFSAVNFHYANNHIDWIKKAATKYYDHVITIQNVWHDKDIPHKYSTLDESFKLKEINRFNKTASTYVKISELVK
jgi:dolichyl-phosphate-mannose-protein mannosyltransferase